MNTNASGRSSFAPSIQRVAGPRGGAQAGTTSTAPGRGRIMAGARANLFGEVVLQFKHRDLLTNLFEDALVQIGLDRAYGTYIRWLGQDLAWITYTDPADFLAQLCAHLDATSFHFTEQWSEAAEKVDEALQNAKHLLAPALLQGLVTLNLTLQFVKKVVDKQNPAWRADDPVAALLEAHALEFGMMLSALESFGSSVTEPDLVVRAPEKEKKSKEKKEKKEKTAKEKKEADTTANKKKPRKSFLGRLSMRFTASDASVQAPASNANATTAQANDQSDDSWSDGDSPIVGDRHESWSEDERRGWRPTPVTTASPWTPTQSTSVSPTKGT